jgi:hypothetical protein
MRTTILHIGTEKTGTTSIQGFLANNARWLLEQGFAYPMAAERWSGHLLALYARGPEVCDDLHVRLGLDSVEKRTTFQRQFADHFAHEMTALPERVRTVLFSSEHLHSRVVAHDAIQSLRSLLRPHFGRIRIVVYLRRQDRVATSLYSTAMKVGLTHDGILHTGVGEGYFDYDRLLDRWAEVFGADAVTPRLLARDQLVDGDLLADLAAVCGLADLASAIPAERHNEGLQAVAQEFLRQASGYVPPIVDSRPNPAWDALVELLSCELVGRGRMPTRREAIRFQADFADSNERVRRRWFPALPTLFDDNFGMYPEQDDPPPGFSDAVAVAAMLWRRAMAEIALRDGRIARLTGDAEAAEHQFRLARTLHPGHAEPVVQRVEHARLRWLVKGLAKRWRRSALARQLGRS